MTGILITIKLIQLLREIPNLMKDNIEPEYEG